MNHFVIFMLVIHFEVSIRSIDMVYDYTGLELFGRGLEFIVTEWPRAIGSVDRGRTLFKTDKRMFGLGHVVI